MSLLMGIESSVMYGGRDRILTVDKPVEHSPCTVGDGHVGKRGEASVEDEGDKRETPPSDPPEDLWSIAGKSEAV